VAHPETEISITCLSTISHENMMANMMPVMTKITSICIRVVTMNGISVRRAGGLSATMVPGKTLKATTEVAIVAEEAVALTSTVSGEEVAVAATAVPSTTMTGIEDLCEAGVEETEALIAVVTEEVTLTEEAEVLTVEAPSTNAVTNVAATTEVEAAIVALPTGEALTEVVVAELAFSDATLMTLLQQINHTNSARPFPPNVRRLTIVNGLLPISLKEMQKSKLDHESPLSFLSSPSRHHRSQAQQHQARPIMSRLSLNFRGSSLKRSVILCLAARTKKSPRGSQMRPLRKTCSKRSNF